MKQSHTSRNYAKAFFTFVVVGLAAACADSASAPTGEVPDFTAPASFTKVGAPKSFRVDNAEGIVQRIGNHVIRIPAGAICDPSLSTYGATEWDKDCTPLQGSIVIKATVLVGADREPYVDFQPSLRFVPSKEVLLFLRNGKSNEPRRIAIMYCDNQGVCIDESLNDPVLKPFRVGTTSMIGRRVKHFSGYTVTWGERCPGTLTQEPDGTWMCNDEGDAGMARRSGYMVASGLDDNGDPKDEEKDGKKDDSK